jgi:hypothetical protein
MLLYLIFNLFLMNKAMTIEKIDNAHLKSMWRIDLIVNISHWFNDEDDASNWLYYQRLSKFGGLTADEVLSKDGVEGHVALMKYVKDKEMRKL